MLRLIVQPFFIDVAMVEFVETLGDGLDQSADNLLKGLSEASMSVTVIVRSLASMMIARMARPLEAG
jgi:hypothetical protein